MDDLIRDWAETLRDAAARSRPLRIRGGGTKDFYGGAPHGELFDARGYSGIIDYEPTELVITARAGTPLDEIEWAMRERGQMLAFEPPHFAAAPDRVAASDGGGGNDPPAPTVVPARTGATLGGCIAAGLSGPRRPYAGSARDLVLGVRILDGQAADLRFGGRVMKNVAGYDVSRLMTGALGTLGVLLEISLKAVPLPPEDITLRLEHTQADALALMNAWAGRPLPISATCHHDHQLYVRLSGAAAGVRAACERLGGERVRDADAFWRQVRDHAHGFFRTVEPLWRVSLKSTAAPLALPGAQLLEWNGALRWLATGAAPEQVRASAARAGGHATLFRGGDRTAGVFHPLQPALLRIHERLKRTFDPAGILNPGRLYPQW